MAIALFHKIRVRGLSLIALTLLALSFNANAREVGIACSYPAQGNPNSYGIPYEPEQLFAKFWIDTASKKALYRLETDTHQGSTGVSESPGAYTLTTYRCKEGRWSADKCRDYTRAIINRSNGTLRFFHFYNNENDVPKMTSREVSGNLECEAVDPDKAKAWIEVSSPKF